MGIEEKEKSEWSWTYTALDELVSISVMKEGRSDKGEKKAPL
jgi:hypothetical protein